MIYVVLAGVTTGTLYQTRKLILNHYLPRAFLSIDSVYFSKDTGGFLIANVAGRNSGSVPAGPMAIVGAELVVSICLANEARKASYLTMNPHLLTHFLTKYGPMWGITSTLDRLSCSPGPSCLLRPRSIRRS
jgi:hypothetical protein